MHGSISFRNQRIERIDGAGNPRPAKGRKVGLGRSRSVDADQSIAPAAEELKIARRFYDNHSGIGHIDAEL